MTTGMCVSTTERAPLVHRGMRFSLILLAAVGIGITSVGCLYGAATAVMRPSRLSFPVLGVEDWPRTDTTALACFLGSAVIVFVMRFVVLSDRGDAELLSQGRPLTGWTRIADALSLTVVLHASAGVVYILANFVAHPHTLGLPLTHHASWPSEGQFGFAAFMGAFLGIRFRRWLLGQKKGRHDRQT
jgi:succinate dehydrogenase hydrophobic anchor subunit